MKNILVIGASGYLGAHICKNFANKGYQITILIRSKEDLPEQWISLMSNLIVGDITNKNTIDAIVENKFDVIINMISLNDKSCQKEPNLISSINVMPTWNLLNKLCYKGLKKFIYFSTAQVYGKPRNINFKENEIVNPENIYGLTHLLSENICNYFNSNTMTECINIRLSNSYGSPILKNNHCWKLVINDFCKRAYNQKQIKIKSDGSPLRDFIHVEDVVEALDLILISHSKKDNNIYNVCSGEVKSILELALVVKKIFFKRYNEKINILCLNKKVDDDLKIQNNNNNLLYNNRRVKKLGFTTKTNYNDGVNEIFDYLEKK